MGFYHNNAYDFRMAINVVDAEDLHDFYRTAGNTHEMLRWATILDTLNEVW